MARIIPQDVFTTEMSKKIACFVASVIRPDSQDVSKIDPSYTYLRREVKRLIEQGVLTYTKDAPRALRFTVYGLERLEAELPGVYRYYMAVSNSNNPGRTSGHKRRIKKQSHAQACMKAAGVELGVERPFLSELLTNGKLKLTHPVYLSTKEIKLLKSDQMKVMQTREQISRASGILVSNPLKAAVYVLVKDEKMHMRKTSEDAFKELMHGTIFEIYNERIKGTGEDCWYRLVLAAGFLHLYAE